MIIKLQKTDRAPRKPLVVSLNLDDQSRPGGSQCIQFIIHDISSINFIYITIRLLSKYNDNVLVIMEFVWLLE